MPGSRFHVNLNRSSHEEGCVGRELSGCPWRAGTGARGRDGRPALSRVATWIQTARAPPAFFRYPSHPDEQEAADLTQHTFATMMRRLSAAGFKSDLVRAAVLPDWWADDCAADPSVLPDIEIRVARFLNAPLAVVRNPGAPLSAPNYPGAQLRRVRDIGRDRLSPAIHAGLRIAEAAVRSWRGEPPPVMLPPPDPLAWRAELMRASTVIRLPDVLSDLWRRGIPVVHLELRPAPSFQGMVCIVDDRPVVVLAHDLDEPARLAFVIAHEVAHVVFGDCEPGHPVVDEEDTNPDDHDVEHRADLYGARMLTTGKIHDLKKGQPRELANQALVIEKAHQIDAALVIRGWGRRNEEHALATQAVHALYRMKGGKRAIREQFDRHVDLDAASESDRALLRCLFGEPERNAPAL